MLTLSLAGFDKVSHHTVRPTWQEAEDCLASSLQGAKELDCANSHAHLEGDSSI